MSADQVARMELAAKVHNLEPLVPAAKRARRRLVDAEARLRTWWDAEEPNAVDVADAASIIKRTIRELDRALRPFDA